tara:strand:- start:11037 stop:11369 length:333 start_codon:yes stop_codon:yes gene_type:complete
MERVKALVAQSKPLLEVSDLVGLRSASRFRDHFVKLEAVTPGEYKTGDQEMTISYGLHEYPFGKVFVALTDRGICKVAFLGEGGASPELDTLKAEWKHALIQEIKRSLGK